MTPKSYKFNRYTRLRIKVALAALAYEVYNDPIISDAEYDKLAIAVYRTRHIGTGNAEMDHFFSTQFQPHTGLWIHKHPNPPHKLLGELYGRKKRTRRRHRRKSQQYLQ